jgi:hypothetical protein
MLFAAVVHDMQQAVVRPLLVHCAASQTTQQAGYLL